MGTDRILFGDFETRSPVDIKKAGADVYAKSEYARVMAFGYGFDDGDITVNRLGQRPPYEVVEHISNNGRMVAHNAAFEWVVWNYCWRREFPDLPPLNIEQLICTLAMSYAMGLPGALEKAAPAAGIDTKKDMQGNRVMLQLSQPRNIYDGFHTWYEPEDYPEKFETMYDYCKQDVVVERELYKKLLHLAEDEKRLWILDHKINQRGIKIDIKAVKAAIKLVEYEKKRLDEKMREITDNAVATCNANAQLKEWLILQGLDLEGVAKNDVLELLDGDLPYKIREVLLTRQEAAKSSNAKLTSMLLSVCDDDRARSLLQYHGAGTGRWAGRRIQIQNLPRSKISTDDIKRVIEVLKYGDRNNS